MFESFRNNFEIIIPWLAKVKPTIEYYIILGLEYYILSS